MKKGSKRVREAILRQDEVFPLRSTVHEGKMELQSMCGLKKRRLIDVE
jgi:hypothetical protein